MTFAFRMSIGISQIISADAMMASAHRCFDFCNIEQETVLEENTSFPLNWPAHGEIVFKNVYMKYKSSQTYVLQNFNLAIKSGEKFGIVGRTGAGKSSILNALFRMYNIEKGSIIIDEQDISQLNLINYRNKISVIPQTPFTFSGTIKENIDPFNDYSESQIWDVLEAVELKPYVKSLTHDILTQLSSKDNVFSIGQKQLLCLARAILRNSKILILDEATSNIDLETEALIQNKIHIFFAKSTIVTIAHRIVTIADYDKVMVLHQGKILEIGEPFELLTTEKNLNEISRNGVFANLVKSLGEKSSQEILNITKRKHFSK